MSRMVFAGQNPRLRSQLQRIAESSGWKFHVVEVNEVLQCKEPPVIIVVQLELKGVIDAISEWKRVWPSAFVAGSIMLPVQELWHAAVASGCDLVANWGALPRQIRERMESYQAGEQLVKKANRLKVLRNEREGDGLIGRLPDAPDGPIVIFRSGGSLCAFRDVCPHAGFSLADGALDGKVITCPQHGSQFNICTGSRLRGPSDFPIRVYRVVVEEGEVFVEV